MTELDDHQLLEKYARLKSEAAFSTLVARHVNLVYSAALRFTSNAHHAEEITQTAFTILAHKAGSLGTNVVLSGWLYQTARLTAANFVKGEIRRQRREQEAYMQSTLTEAEGPAWEKIAPLLDEAMGRLGETDRNAVVLRFFENKTAQEVATTLQMNEAAAHKRVSRALEKLRKFFVKRGVVSTTAVIAGVVSANSVQAAPVALIVSISAVAITNGAIATGSTLTLIQGALKIMAWTKAKMAIVSAIVVAGVATPLVIQHQANVKLREENRSLRLQVAVKSNDFASQVDSSELSRLQKDRAELLRLRDEVGRLRGQKQELAKLRAEIKPQVATPVQKPDKNKLSKDSWVDAGFATPEETLQTRGWTVLNANRERFKESVFITDDGKKMLEGMLDQMIAGSPDPEKARQEIQDNGLTLEDAMLFPMIGKNQSSGGFIGYQILSRQSPSENEMVMEVETQMASGPAHQETMKFRRIGNEWKVVIDAETITENLKKDAK